MRHTLRSYFVEVVLPTYEAFILQHSDREMGLLRDTTKAGSAAEALLNIPDHAFNDTRINAKIRSHHNNVRSYRESFWSTCEEYEVVCDFANAWKHRSISRKGKRIASLDDVKELCVIATYCDSQGIYYVTRKRIEIKCLDGRKFDLSHLLKKSMLLWIKELIRLCVLSGHPKFPEAMDDLITRDQASRLPRM